MRHIVGMRTSTRILILLGTPAIALPLWLFLCLPPYLADSEIRRHGTLNQVAAIEPDKYALVVDEYRKTVSQAIGGFGLVGTLLVSVWRLRANEHAKVAERFGKALDHLGALRSGGDKAASEVRIGAVSELEGVGEESPREKRMIHSSFVAYLRNYANWSSARKEKSEPAMWRMSETQAMMSVLGRWGIPEATKDAYQLADVDFRHLQLLPGAKVTDIIAPHSCFDYVVLKDVDMRNGDLKGTEFRGAKLEGADFRGADLSDCNFVGRNSTQAEERWGLKRDTRLFGWGGDSPDATLQRANMSGIDLSTTHMTQGQYDSILRDAQTKAPQTFSSPATHKI